MRLAEAIKAHPFRTGLVALGLGVVAADAALYYNAQGITYDIPSGSCASPWAISQTYVSPGTNTWLETYTGIRTPGVVVRAQLPAGAYGIQASFRRPNGGDVELKVNASRMLKADQTGSAVAKLAIGNGEVQFGERIVAPIGSNACNAVPAVTFDRRNAQDYPSTPGALPWPNPINVAAQALQG